MKDYFYIQIYEFTVFNEIDSLRTNQYNHYPKLLFGMKSKEGLLPILIVKSQMFKYCTDSLRYINNLSNTVCYKFYWYKISLKY